MAAEEVMSAISEVACSVNLVMKEKPLGALATFISGQDDFVSLPTGYGKSLMFPLLPPVFDIIKGKKESIVVYVSPLTSLMMDQ
uniref:DEAD/DEAH-box helicase domain-containing protein n=1 Tax=Amphimedon queenslandica TaxID=400682 RepID=A0A1X7V4Z1_AMPQE